MKQYIYVHAHRQCISGYIVKTSVKINPTLTGYLFTVLGDRECQVAPDTKAPYIVLVLHSQTNLRASCLLMFRLQALPGAYNQNIDKRLECKLVWPCQTNILLV